MSTGLRQGGLAPARRALDNGAVVLAKESRATPAVTILASVDAGAIGDPSDAPGTAWFLSRVIDRGTARQDAEEIGEWLDSRGVALHVAATRHQLVVSCTCLSDDFRPMLQLVGDVLRSPSLPEREIETRRVEVLTAIRQDQDSPAVMAVEAALRLLYPGGHPYGLPLKGTTQAVERIGRDALAAHHRRYVGPSSLVVACVGDVDAGLVLEEADRAFGSWRDQGPLSAAAPPGVPAASGRRQSVIEMAGKAQTDIGYGFVSLARRDPAYYALSILNNVLGQYALGGRLGDSIRERQGMAYYVFSAFDATVWESPLLIRAGVSPANVERTIASIDEELRKLVRDGVTPQELAASRTYLIMSMPRVLETNAGIAQFLQSCEQFGLGLDYDVRLPGILEAVTLDEVNDLARRFLIPERAAMAVAGPAVRP
jgi:zinc protease